MLGKEQAEKLSGIWYLEMTRAAGLSLCDRTATNHLWLCKFKLPKIKYNEKSSTLV